MRRSARRTTKKKLPKLVAAFLVLLVTAVLVPLTGAWFSKEPPVGLTDQQRGNDPESVLDISRRSTIYDRGYRELAVSFMMKSLYARPLEIEDIDGTAAFVGERLGLDPVELGRRLKSERSFVWLGRRLPEERARTVLQKDLAGIYAIEESQRFYPARRSGAHVVGFVEENNGLAGVELNFDHILRRGSGGAAGGGHLQLTLDLRIQELLAEGLDGLMAKTGAVTGTGIVMNYKTGAVLAMVAFPDYDPNSYWDAGQNGRLNRAVNGGIELGGFSSLFGLAAAREMAGGDDNRDRLSSLKIELLLESRAKEARSGEWFEERGAELLSPEFKGWRQAATAGGEQVALLAELGLFGKSGIDLPETVAGSQETGRTTPLNLLSAFAVLVNGGRGITPYVGEAVVDPSSGRRTSIARPEPQGKLIGERTSRGIVGLLAEASRSGPEAIFLESMRPAGRLSEAREGAEESVEEPESRFRTVLIGFTPGQDGVALLVALDGAVVEADKKTLMRNLGEDVIGRMAALAIEQVDPPSPEVMAAGEKRIFETWLGSQAYDHLVAAAVNTDPEVKRPEVMPDLHGLSLRKGLRVLQTFGVKVTVVGSGRIVEQEPAAGAVFDGGECRLSLRSDV